MLGGLRVYHSIPLLSRLASNQLNREARSKMLGSPAKRRPDPAFMKINTPEFQSIFTEELNILSEIFGKYNYELRIAGGAVRDILLQQKPKDIDFATTATPTEMKEMFKAEQVRTINDNGEKHGTITPRIGDENFEVTTLRIDVRTDGRHAEVEFTTDWQLDANRRDLTINSMFLGLDGTVYDYFYGYEDLQARRVRFVGDAKIRIQEDYLRILRYFRFYGRIAIEEPKHDPNTIQAIKQNVDGLARISGERLWMELQKIAIGNFNKELIVELLHCGVGKYCGLPENPNVPEFERLCNDLKANFQPPHYAILFIIALLNDKNDAMMLHDRLKLSAFERDLALFIVQQKQHVDNSLETLLDYQKLAMGPNIKQEFVAQLLKYSNKPDLYKEISLWEKPKFPVNGKMLSDVGCPPDYRMGYITNELKALWNDSKFTLTAEELLTKHYPAIKEKSAQISPPASQHKKKRKAST